MEAGERAQLISDATATVKNVVYPSYRRLIAEEQSIRPRATHDAGVWHIRGGDAYYADQLKQLTSTDMTPEEILADYPDLGREDISACLAFAARLSSVHRILPLTA